MEATPSRPAPAAAQPAPIVPAEPFAAAAAERPQPTSAPAAVPPPSDPLVLWQLVTESLDGLAADFAATVTAAAWRDGVLEVSLPADAATAASFLRRPDSAAAIAAGIEASAGHPLRHAILLAPPRPAGVVPERPPQPVVASQAALVRAATDHPLVAHARSLFDAAIRKVEPLRPREIEPAVVTVSAGEGVASAAGGDAGPSDEEAEGEDG